MSRKIFAVCALALMLCTVLMGCADKAEPLKLEPTERPRQEEPREEEKDNNDDNDGKANIFDSEAPKEDGVKENEDELEERPEYKRSTLAAGSAEVVAVAENGTILDTKLMLPEMEAWTDVIAVSAEGSHVMALRKDGTVVNNDFFSRFETSVDEWSDIVAISAGYAHGVGLKADGTVVAAGNNVRGECDVYGWRDIVAVAAGLEYTLGLRADGTVVAAGSNDSGQCNVQEWTDIVAIAAGGYSGTSVGLRSDGTLVCAGNLPIEYEEILTWTNIIAIYVSDNNNVAALKDDGTVVVARGSKPADEPGKQESLDIDSSYEYEKWTDIVAVAAGSEFVAGLRADGSVLVADILDAGEETNWEMNEYEYSPLDAAEWKGIRLP